MLLKKLIYSKTVTNCVYPSLLHYFNCLLVLRVVESDKCIRKRNKQERRKKKITLLWKAKCSSMKFKLYSSTDQEEMVYEGVFGD